MVASLLCLLLSLSTASAPAPVPATAAAAQDPDRKAEFERRLKAAGDDVEALWELYNWCDAYGLTREARKTARAILDVDESHRKANEALGHIEYDGKWFKSEKQLEKYKREEEERIKKAQGLVKWEDDWVPAADLPYLKKGLRRTKDGRWVSEEEYERIEQGWVQQDLVWVPPAEAANIEKGLWKCGEDWLTLEEANEYHARVETWWVIPTENYVVHSTCKRETAMKAVQHIENAYGDLVRIYGVTPKEKLNVALLRSIEQYREFAGEDPVGTSGIFGAYFAINWMDDEEKIFYGGGVGYWDDTSNEGNSWGPHYARYAAGLSFSQSVDPSPKALASFAKSRSGDLDVRDFLSEKKVPRWLRRGAASYVARHWIDVYSKNRTWAREWSVENILRQGGLNPLRQIFAMDLGFETDEDKDRAAKLVNEAGLLVAFVLDGDVPEVKQAHEGVKTAIQSGEGITESVAALEKAIEAAEPKLRKFAGL